MCLTPGIIVEKLLLLRRPYFCFFSLPLVRTGKKSSADQLGRERETERKQET